MEISPMQCEAGGAFAPTLAIRQPSLSLQARVETITPEKASEMLAHNIGNRPMRRDYVAELVALILRGEFALNGEAIKLAHDGTVLDGQHRLAAIARAGIPVQVLVVRGVDKSAFITIDRGRPRTNADVLGCDGYKNATKLAATVSLVWRYMRGEVHRSFKPTAAQMLEVMSQFPHITESVDFTMVLYRKQDAPVIAVPSVVAAIHAIVVQGGTARDAVEEFFARVVDGVGLSAESPVLRLRSRLLSVRTGSWKLKRNAEFAITIKAWNAYALGESLKVLKWADYEAMPTIAFGPTPAVRGDAE